MIPANTTRFSETRNFEVNRVVSRTVGPKLAVKRLHLAVLVDSIPPVKAGGKPTARTAADIEQIGKIAREAAGIDDARGDKVEVYSMSFAPAELDPVTPPVPASWLTKKVIYALSGGGALLLLALGGLVFWLMRRKKPTAGKSERPLTMPPLPARISDVEAMLMPMPGQEPRGMAPETARDRALDAARADATRAARVLTGWINEAAAAAAPPTPTTPSAPGARART